MLVGVVVHIDPAAVAVVIGLGQNFSLGAAALRAGVGLDAGVLTGGLRGGLAAIPLMGSGLFLLADGADMLVSVVVHIDPVAVAVVLGLGNDFLHGAVTDGAGAGLDTLILTGRILGNSACVQAVALGLGAGADGAGMYVMGIIQLGPCAVAVLADNADSSRLNIGRDRDTAVLDGGSAADSSIAEGGGIGLDLQLEGADGAVIGHCGVQHCDKALVAIVEAGKGNAAERGINSTGTGYQFKYVGVKAQGNTQRLGNIRAGVGDGKGNDVTALQRSLVSFDSESVVLRGQSANNDVADEQNADQQGDQFFHSIHLMKYLIPVPGGHRFAILVYTRYPVKSTLIIRIPQPLRRYFPPPGFWAVRRMIKITAPSRAAPPMISHQMFRG